MALASQLYQKVVDTFTQEDFETFEFPRIVKEDWPNVYKIKYAMADLLYVQERWEDCGPAFDAVVAENPNSPEAPEAAYASVLCYQKMYDQVHKGNDKEGMGQGPTNARAKQSTEAEWEKFKPKNFTDMQKGMIQAFNRYVCYIKPPEGNKQAYDQYVEVKYARARTYFEAQHWDEAAIAFRDVALNHSDHDSATYAAQLYLESLNVLGSKSKTPKPACYEDMGEDVPAFLELFCGEGKYENNKEQCEPRRWWSSPTRVVAPRHSPSTRKRATLTSRSGARTVNNSWPPVVKANAGPWKRCSTTRHRPIRPVACWRSPSAFGACCSTRSTS
jgi:hypothetical protein